MDNKKEIAAVIGIFLTGITVGSTFAHRKFRKRIAQWQPLMANAFLTMLMRLYENPDITPEEVREQGEIELAFMRIAMEK